MVDEVKDLTSHLLTEIHRIHNSHDRIFDKLSEQGETLVRNTVSLEDHVRRTNLLEQKMTHVETEVDGLKIHVIKINTLMSFLKPTKEKIKWLILLASLLGGSYGSYQLADQTTFSKAIQAIQKVIQ